MVFTDNLAYSLFAISFAGLLLLYTLASMYLSYRRREKSFIQYAKGASVPLTLLGIYMVVMGLWGQFTWPLPGSYNILFYDPLISFGIVLLAFSIAINFDTKLEYPGFLSLLFGAMLILYGYEGYIIGLTKEPLALLGLYLLYGSVGILAFPLSLVADKLPGLKRNSRTGRTFIFIILLILLLLASLLAAYIGYAAVSGHLINAP
jgi:putative membrane protein